MFYYPNSNYNYAREVTKLDEIEIDGEVIRGYAEYSFLEEKSYTTQPVRGSDGSIADIDEYTTFLTPRIIIKYTMMNMDEYRKLMKKLNDTTKNAHIVSCYDIVNNQRVWHEMYFAPTSMPVIYQRYLAALGVQDFTIELIGTNNPIKDLITITLRSNVPSGSTPKEGITAIPEEKVFKVPRGAWFTVGFPVSSTIELSKSIKGWDIYCWEETNGSREYRNNSAYKVDADLDLTALWGVA